MMQENSQQIESKIINLKGKIKDLRKEEGIKKRNENRKLRVKSNGNSKSNELVRVSNSFAKRLELINNKREENGFDRLSNPKITDLIIKHKIGWKKIKEDIILFNTSLEQDEEEEFNDEK